MSQEDLRQQLWRHCGRVREVELGWMMRRQELMVVEQPWELERPLALRPCTL